MQWFRERECSSSALGSKIHDVLFLTTNPNKVHFTCKKTFPKCRFESTQKFQIKKQHNNCISNMSTYSPIVFHSCLKQIADRFTLSHVALNNEPLSSSTQPITNTTAPTSTPAAAAPGDAAGPRACGKASCGSASRQRHGTTRSSTGSARAREGRTVPKALEFFNIPSNIQIHRY